MPRLPSSVASPPLYSAAELRAVEAKFAAAGLMEKAGAAAAELATSLASEAGGPVLVLVGPGNNGGDALVAARMLAAQGWPVHAVGATDPARLPADAARAFAAWRKQGGSLQAEVPALRFGLVVDGLFGAGLQRDVAGTAARWIAQANALVCARLALDVPSGLDGDSGRVRGCVFRADHTLTFLGLKPGLLTADGPDYAGQVHLDTLGVDPADMPAAAGTALTGLEARHRLPPRAQNSHKGQFGHVGVIGGAPGMVGACLLAGRAALEHGAGSVSLAVLDERVAVDYGAPRLMFAAAEALVEASPDVLAVGPGLGRSTRARALLQAALRADSPLVLDADALNLVAADPELGLAAEKRNAARVLTPHPGEAGRLLGVDTRDVQADRVAAARELSTRFGAHVALKGAGTVIAHPGGRYAINTSGGPWLAQAGSGDRLTGMVAALLGQGMEAGNALEAAVWLHGAERPENQHIRVLR
ncbi:MAG: NAD(P)H-hydrate dehydratase [Thiobacillus sp.]